MLKKRNEVLELIFNIWGMVYPSYKYKFSLKIIDLLRVKRDNIEEHNLGYLYSLLMCIKYAIPEKSSTHNKLENYLDELDKMDKRTFIEWLKN